MWAKRIASYKTGHAAATEDPNRIARYGETDIRRGRNRAARVTPHTDQSFQAMGHSRQLGTIMPKTSPTGHRFETKRSKPHPRPCSLERPVLGKREHASDECQHAQQHGTPGLLADGTGQTATGSATGTATQRNEHGTRAHGTQPRTRPLTRRTPSDAPPCPGSRTRPALTPRTRTSGRAHAPP